MKHLLLPILSLGLFIANAQTLPPKNFKAGELMLLDGTRLKGFIKDNMRKDASLSFVDLAGGTKKQYHAGELQMVRIENDSLLCLQGDFFELISDGNIAFLRKRSDASKIAVYNGLEPIYPYGTPGHPDDYFIYEKATKQLSLVSPKNIKLLAATIFKDYSPAITMAEKAYQEIRRLKEAVELYNQHLR